MLAQLNHAKTITELEYSFFMHRFTVTSCEINHPNILLSFCGTAQVNFNLWIWKSLLIRIVNKTTEDMSLHRKHRCYINSKEYRNISFYCNNPNKQTSSLMTLSFKGQMLMFLLLFVQYCLVSTVKSNWRTNIYSLSCSGFCLYPNLQVCFWLW